MSKKEEATNIVYLAGKIKMDPKVDENVTRALIDLPGMKNAIPVGVRKGNDGLAEKLGRFRQGDFIQLIAMLDPYGVKQADGTWKNGLAVRITDIKTAPPNHAPKQAQQKAFADDDVPF